MVYSNALKYNGRRFRFFAQKKRKIYVIKKKLSTIAMGDCERPTYQGFCTCAADLNGRIGILARSAAILLSF